MAYTKRIDDIDRTGSAGHTSGTNSANSTEDSRRTLRRVGDALITAGVALGALTVALMLYLQRGTYDPMDVLVLLAMCATIAGCPLCVVAGVIVRIVGAMPPATPQPSRDVRASGRARARDRPDTAR
ncbi:hypothetical protein [Bifidobacterium ramosum]|uniref:Uncharacterized protein n=1 Tax=Bifidobacterium ramosum TaxID=1798158 RepID=A0A7K3TD82_9BIFI|nr:hypothetical protein [Bifidobacterium ramosum]NEG72538.1 hypothetical protein [Bifidobacterium ramosum]